MDDKAHNYISLNKFFRIKTKATKKTYIDEEIRCYLTDTMKEADDIIARLKTIGVETYRENAPESFQKKEYCGLFYEYGITTLWVKFAKEKDARIYEIEKDDVPPGVAYNEDTCADINRLFSTSKLKYLRSLKNEPLFCPVIIDPRFKKQYPTIRYGKAMIKGKEHFIMFSDLKSFDEWNETQDLKWSPFKTSIFSFQDIRKAESIIINPMSEKLILNNQTIKDSFREKR